MKYNYIKSSITAFAAIGLFTACEPEIDREGPAYDQVRGEADFSVYVALGNSLTAGYADGALNRHGQINSYPAIMADKMASVTPGFEFDQPLLPAGIANGTIEFKGISANGQPNLVPVTNGLSNEELLAPVSGRFNNMGVPGAKVGDLITPGYGQANPYFGRFASEENATVVDDAVNQDPTFFTLWIGNNDVLGFATQGGRYRNENGEIVGPSITSAGDFEESYRQIINRLTASNSSIEGALANIPNISNIPYINTVPWNGLELTAENAAELNAGFIGSLRNQVIYGVIEEGARRQIIQAIVVEGARRQVISQVAPRVVYQQAYEQAYEGAIAQGSNETEAEAFATQQAEGYVASEDGQQAIQDLSTNLIQNRQPEQVHAIVEQNLASEEVQNQITATATAAYEDETVLGEEGVRNLNETFSSTEIQNRIQQNYEGALEADAEGQLATAIGPEGAAAVEATQQAQITQLRSMNFFPEFKEGANGFVVASEQSPTGFKQLTADEKILLTALLEGVLNSEFLQDNNYILPDRFALDQFELGEINGAIAAYNAAIANIARENTFALVDINSFFDEIAKENGYTVEGTTFTTAFVTGNAFSLDGVHLTQRGYALVAKQFIQDINSYYGSQLPEPRLANYPTLGLPASN